MASKYPPTEALDYHCWSQIASILFSTKPVEPDSFTNRPWTITIHPSEDPTDQDRIALTETFYTYRQHWYYPPSSAQQLRARYHNDRDNYFSKFRLSEDKDAPFVFENAMRRYISLEKHMLSKIRWKGLEKLWLKGRELVDSLANATTTTTSDDNDPALHNPNLTIVSIDFEPSSRKSSLINQFGIATFALRTNTFACKNFIRSRASHRRGNPRFLFPPSVPIGGLRTSWRETILSELSSCPTTQILLIGHSLRSTELGILEALHIDVETDLPLVVGIFDTESLVPAPASRRKAYKMTLSLAETMEALGMRFERKRLHCAGNDAVYTLRVLLEVLRRQGWVGIEGVDVEGFVQVERQGGMSEGRGRRDSACKGGVHEKNETPCETYFDAGMFANE